MASVKPFTLDVPETELENLQQKLSLTVFPDELGGAGWDYGAPLADVKRLTEYWKDTFSWRDAESKINHFPNYRTTINVEGFESLDIHFIHVKSSVETAIPLLFVHGCKYPTYSLRQSAKQLLRPGSFLKVSKLLPLLIDNTNNAKPSFHIVAPSLPNFGFSSEVKKRGFGLGQYAETCHRLMLALGYEQYVSQGGDIVTQPTSTFWGIWLHLVTS